MNTKRKKTGRRVLSFLLTLAMVVGLMPGMSLTAYAKNIKSTDITVEEILAKDDVIFFARVVYGHGNVIVYYHPFQLKVYMDNSIVKNVSTQQQNSPPDNEYTVPKKCSVVSYSDNLQDNVYNHTLKLKSLEISDATITIQVTNTTYDGNAHLPDVTVKNASEETLTYNTDYMLSASQTDVGTYSVTVSGIGNYTGSQALSNAWSITKGTNSFTTQPVSTNLAYTGEQIPLLSNGGAAKWGTIQYSMDNESWSTEIPKKTDAGTYTVYYMVPATKNYDEISGMVTASIIQKPTARNNLTYTGEPQELVTPPGDVPTGYTVQYSLDGTNWSTEIPKGTDVGNYTVKVKYVDDNNHKTFDGEDIPVTIALELTDAQKPKAKDNLTYTGEPQELVTASTAALPEPYRIVYALGDANGPTEEYTTSIPAKTDAGTYYVWYKVIADANHNDSEPVCIKVVIQSGAYAVLKVDNADHTIGSGQNAVITVKRSAGDDRTFSLYTGAAMDGTPIASGNCDTAPGSLILTLKSFYLDSLSVGDHKLTISFQDGSVDTTVKILPAASSPTPTPKPVPKTGDSANPALWLAMMLVALIGFAGLAVTGKMKASRKKK